MNGKISGKMTIRNLNLSMKSRPNEGAAFHSVLKSSCVFFEMFGSKTHTGFLGVYPASAIVVEFPFAKTSGTKLRENERKGG